MVSLRALKNQGCISEHWPLPAVHAYGVTKKDDVEEDEEDDVIVPKQLTPERPIQPPFPFTEENIPKLKSWLANAFSTSSFNTSSAPMAKMSGPAMKIHVNPNAVPVAIQKTNFHPTPLAGPSEGRPREGREAGHTGEGSHGSAHYLAV